MKKITLPAALLFLVFSCVAQTGGLRVAPGIRLPDDSVAGRLLMGSLSGWMAAGKGPDSVNEYVAEGDRPAMAVLMGQMRNLKGDCYVGALTPWMEITGRCN